MKIILISDTHCGLRKIDIPEGDLLIHSGDLTFRGNIQEISQELHELGRIAKNFKYGCVFIAGNHDGLGETDPTLMKQMAIDEGLTYLDHSSIEIKGIKIFGSAYTPFFCNWYFNIFRGEALEEKWAQIPDDTNVLITHGPPMGILDAISKFNGHQWIEEKVGCQDLYNRIQQLKSLKLHVFGHIHCGYGTIKIGDVSYVNASICTEDYRPINKPHIVSI